jgi:CRISPR-associated protein Csh2
MTATLSSRREVLFLYDIRMGNPNGDPDENRPRQLPDGTFYVTDVRLKRFVRDYFKLRGQEILVDQLDQQAVDLGKRVYVWMEEKKKKQLNGKELVDAILDGFIDARLFGSSLAMKEQKKKEQKEKEQEKEQKEKEQKDKFWKAEPQPKTLTGAVQFNHGEVLHPAEELLIRGTSTFSSGERKDGTDRDQGTFTDYACLRYALIGFSGVANEHSAALSRMTDDDYEALLHALWNGVRSAANTRTKTQQSPRLLVDIRYKPNVEYQIGNLITYVKPVARGAKSDPKHWASCDDFTLDLSRLVDKLEASQRAGRIDTVFITREADLQLSSEPPAWWKTRGLDH